MEASLKAANEHKTDIKPLKKHALTFRSKIHQMQLQIAEEMLKVQQLETRLEENVSTTSYFLDRTQDVLEILKGRLNWLETTKEPPVDSPIKDLETVKLEYEMIGFGSKAVEELVKAVWRTKGVCAEFCRKVLTTYNHCQTSAKRRLEGLPDHEGFLKQLQVIRKEDEQGIQLVKGLDEKVLKTVIA